MTLLLLLLQLDGTLMCVSLPDGAVRWGITLPGGSLTHCGPTPHTKMSSTTLTQQHRICGRCRDARQCCADASAAETKILDPIAENWVGKEWTCCLLTRDGTETSAQWILTAREEKSAALRLEDVVQRWNNHSCPAHRVVELTRRDASYAEFDLLTGRTLSLLHTHMTDSSEEANAEMLWSSLRLTMCRVEDTRTVVLPIGGSWYATNSTIELNVFDTPVDNEATLTEVSTSSSSSSCPAASEAIEVAQTLKETGVMLQVRRNSVETMVLSLDSPLLCAYSVSLRGDSLCSFEKISIIPATPGPSAVASSSPTSSSSPFLLSSPSFWRVPLHGALSRGGDAHLCGFYHKPSGVGFARNPTEHILDSSTGDGNDNGNEGNDWGLYGAGHSSIEEEASSPTVTSGSPNWEIVRRASATSEARSNTSLRAMRCGTSFFDENFEALTLLGSGVSGAVVLTRHRVTGVFYAVKVILVRDYLSEQAALQEVRLHALLQNRHLVRYYACWSEPVTSRWVHQLASIGLCNAKEARGLTAVSSQETLDMSARHGSAVIGRDWLLMPPPPTHRGGAYLVGEDDDEYHDEDEDGHGERDKNRSADVSYDVPSSNNTDTYASSNSSLSSSTVSSSASERFFRARVVFLQLEFCQTTLAHRLGARSCIDRVENIVIALHIFSGLRYLHNNGCLHRDVKPSNVFLDYRSQLASGMDDSSDNDNECDMASAFVHFGGTCVSTELATAEDTAHLLREPGRSAFELLQTNTSFDELVKRVRRLHEAGSKTKLRELVRAVQKWLRRRLVQVRLGDFGLSKLINEQHVEVAGYFDRSAINTVGIGSPIYSSPEQLEGNICTADSDAFACGVMVAEMYMQPKTVSERLVELRRVRESHAPDEELIELYPELRVVQGLTRRDPKSRISLTEASRMLSQVLDDILSAFLLSSSSSS